MVSFRRYFWFSKMVVQIHTPSRSVPEFQFLYILTSPLDFTDTLKKGLLGFKTLVSPFSHILSLLYNFYHFQEIET